MKKVLLIIAVIFLLSMIFVKRPSGDLKIRIQNSTKIDINKLWLGGAKHSSRYFFRGDRTVTFSKIDHGKKTGYKNIFNTRTGLRRVEFNVLSTNKNGREIGILYRTIGSLLKEKRHDSKLKGDNKILAPGKYTLKITSLTKDNHGQKAANFILIKDE